MAGKQFTKCVPRANYDGLCGVGLANLAYMLLYGLSEAILGLVLGALLGAGLGQVSCFMLAGAIAGFVTGLADGLQERFENQRLICISNDECALGRVAYHKTGPSKGFPAAIDNDFTMNLILVPHAQDTDQAIVMNDGAQGQRLLRRQFNDLSYDGYDPPNATLHCEFEGNRLRAVCNAARAAALPLGAAACICMFVPPLVCLALILAILAIFGLSGWFSGEDGSPADAATDPESGTVEDGDCVVVRGVHVYDAGHCEGWHEIHPVLHVQKLCGKDDADCIVGTCFEADSTDPAVQQRVNDLVTAWCRQLGQPQEDDVILRQKLPENRWVFHPDIDGCRVPTPIP